jgi:hypothetical protein
MHNNGGGANNLIWYVFSFLTNNPYLGTILGTFLSTFLST